MRANKPELNEAKLIAVTNLELEKIKVGQRIKCFQATKSWENLVLNRGQNSSGVLAPYRKPQMVKWTNEKSQMFCSGHTDSKYV